MVSRRQVLAVRRKSNTVNKTRHGKHNVGLVVPVIEIAEQMTPPTCRELECEPS